MKRMWHVTKSVKLPPLFKDKPPYKLTFLGLLAHGGGGRKIYAIPYIVQHPVELHMPAIRQRSLTVCFDQWTGPFM